MTKRITKPFIAALLSLCLLLAAACMFGFMNAGAVKADATAPLTESELSLVKAAGWFGDTGATKLNLQNETFDSTEGIVAYDVEISTAEQLARLAYLVNKNEKVTKDEVEYVKAYNVTLTADIDLENKLWIPIGSMARGVAWDGNTFRGSVVGAKGGVKGQPVTISNLNSDSFYKHVKYGEIKTDENSYYVDCGSSGKIPFETKGDKEYCYGLIATAAGVKVGEKTEVRLENINVIDVKIDMPDKTLESDKPFNNDRCGALVGYIFGNLAMNNCVTGKADDYIRNTAQTGGLLGNVYAGYTDGKPSGSSGKDAGTYITITNCKNYIDIETAAQATYFQKGGIVGYIYQVQTLIISGCENYGDIYGGYAGGITSYMQLSVNNWQGESAEKPFVISTSFIDCKNEGTVCNITKADGNSNDVGGIIGALTLGTNQKAKFIKTDYIFKGCENSGNVIDLGKSNAGGIVGKLQASSAYGSVNITDCVNDGAVKSYATAGGITGSFESSIETVLNKCVNNGDITATESQDVAKHAGGIIGVINQSPMSSEDSNKQALGATDLYNYGTINTCAWSSLHGSTDTKNRSYAGGIFGKLHIGENADKSKKWINDGCKDEEYPYLPLNITNAVNAGKVTVTGEYRGDRLCVGGISGAITSTAGGQQQIWRLNVEACVNTYGSVNEIDFFGTANADKREGVVSRKPTSTAEAINVNQAELELSEDGKTVLGLRADASGAIKIVIPNTVTDIAANAFAGLGTWTEKGDFPNRDLVGWNDASDRQHIFQVNTPKLVVVEFAAGSKLESIGDCAFAGTDIKEITLPASVKTIGVGAFAQTQLERVVINSAATLGNGAFGNNSFLKQVELINDDITFGDNTFTNMNDAALYVIANGKAQYTALNEKDFKEYLTYAVTIEYYDLSVSVTEPAGTELKLFGKDYQVSYNKKTGLWSKNTNIDYVGTVELGRTTQWFNNSGLTGGALNVDTATLLLNSADETVKLYTGTIGEGTSFIARTDLVFGTNYPVTAINTLLAPNSKKVTTEIVTITQFNGENTGKKSFYEAGEYTVTIGSDTVTIVIEKAKIYLANASTLEWRVNNTITLFDSDGKINSVVRSRGSELTLSLYNDEAKGYKAISTDNRNTAAGTYTSTFTLTADDNHEFVYGTAADAKARGLEVTLSGDGTVTVVKTWYIVDMDNWFVDAKGDDYKLANVVYGSTVSFAAPGLKHGTNTDITLQLFRNGEPVLVNGNNAFTVADFTKCFNKQLPVGEYRLVMKADALDYYEEYAENGDPIESSKLHCDGFTQEIVFSITPAMLADEQIKAITYALYNGGETFEFILNNSDKGNAATAETAVKAALEQLRLNQPSVEITGNVWTVGSATVTVNLASAMSNVYGAWSDLPSKAGVYTYYYRISLDNYYTVETDEDGKLYSFTVAVFEYVDLPSVADLAKTYTGEKLTADVVGSDKYNVTENDGGTNKGEYDVVFELIHPEYMLWNGQTLANKTATYTLKFNITKATNDWSVKPTLTNWITGQFDETENGVMGNALFGYETMKYTVTDTSKDENVLFDSTKDDISVLNTLKPGDYFIKVTVDGNDNYTGLESSMLFHVFKTPGLPWWATLLIVIGSLGLAALIIFILWKKGVFQIVTDKIILAIKTRVSVDATIASVRAAKMMEAGKQSVAEAKRKERIEEARKKAQEHRALPPEERAAQLEARAQAEAEKAEKIRLRSEQMQARAAKLRGETSEQPFAEDQQPVEAAQEVAAADATENPTEE